LQLGTAAYESEDDDLTPRLSQGQGFAHTFALPAVPGASVNRPPLRHANSSATPYQAAVPIAGPNRNRSGSLTALPTFGSSWLSTGYGVTPARSPLGQSPPSANEMSDLPSPDSTGSFANNDLSHSTLGYLGLEDDPDDNLPPASMSELRSRRQRAIAINGPASRLRASTVSIADQQYRPSVMTRYDTRSGDASLADSMSHMELHGRAYQSGGQPNLYAASNLIKDAHRPRATTIGEFDNPHRRGGSNYLESIPQSPVDGHHPNHILSEHYNYARSHSSRDLTQSRDSSVGRGRLSISSRTSRAATPDLDRAGTSTPQMPTRSLWIGNLDVTVTEQALLLFFRQYGQIESLRMLPEKVGFRYIPLTPDLRVCQLYGQGDCCASS
jgi:protein JSN1